MKKKPAQVKIIIGFVYVYLLIMAGTALFQALPPLLALRDFQQGELQSYTGRCRIEESRFDKWGEFHAYTFTTTDNIPLEISRNCFTLAGLEDGDVRALAPRTITYTYCGREWLGYRVISVSEGEKVILPEEVTRMDREEGGGWLVWALLCAGIAVCIYMYPLYRRHISRQPRLK